ncbi:efflux RND transporter periplasmic adaptor subunit [Sulfurirhabdus autotrophica]|uniref:Cu(I)/Ag(I) efflux system membrane fusion protein n=1 Tax=Sulfurirhabdus autotrophica TaxID=1706046 RepID=A0A4R3YDY7_9PROT|nr:efflux RND transporter periplasmic adaptor subunit [Sulfurirhabdus autotrophica]TCV89054.1 Cu(I)/Ag(I) efflux system membrane fusion protein [Sulfurirhabdus autotrophica]
MNKKILFPYIASAIILAGLGAAGGYWLASRPYSDAGIVEKSTQNSPSEKADRKALYWYDPMVPNQHFDNPGKSPFMDMELVAQYADEGGSGASGVRIDPMLTQNTGVKFAMVETGKLEQDVEAVASLGFNERLVAIVQSRTGGIVERVYALAPNDIIAAGAPLVDVRVPEWYGAQAEYIALKKSGDTSIVGAALGRLQQLGMSKAQISRMEKLGKPLEIVTISSPLSGVLLEVNVREGMIVTPGQMLTKINGLSSVWLEAEVPESQSSEIAVGKSVSAKFTAWPEQAIEGRVTALLPELNRETRTIRVRMEFPNPNEKLRPGMYARVSINNATSHNRLLVPSAAIIATGKRNLVIVADENNRYHPAEVEVGREGNGKTEILSGLNEGEKVIASGQFMIDSEASLKGVLARMESQKKTSASPVHEAHGKVEELSADDITISHGPVPSIGWGAMTMSFNITDKKLAKGIKAGDIVNFSFHESDTGMNIDHIEKSGGSQ